MCEVGILLSHCWQAGSARPYNSPSAQAPGAAVLSERVLATRGLQTFFSFKTFTHLDVTPGSRSLVPEHGSGIIKPSVGEMSWQTAGLGDGFLWKVRRRYRKLPTSLQLKRPTSILSTLYTVISVHYVSVPQYCTTRCLSISTTDKKVQTCQLRLLRLISVWNI